MQLKIIYWNGSRTLKTESSQVKPWAWENHKGDFHYAISSTIQNWSKYEETEYNCAEEVREENCAECKTGTGEGGRGRPTKLHELNWEVNG